GLVEKKNVAPPALYIRSTDWAALWAACAQAIRTSARWCKVTSSPSTMVVQRSPSDSNRKARPERTSASALAMSDCTDGRSRKRVEEPIGVFSFASSTNASMAPQAMPGAGAASAAAKRVMKGHAYSGPGWWGGAAKAISDRLSGTNTSEMTKL